LGSILTFLRERTRIADWVGSVGLGVCSTGLETFERPGMAVMVATLPAGAFHVFAPVNADLERLSGESDAWIREPRPRAGVVHGDPRRAELMQTLAALTARSSAFLVGGLAAARQQPVQIAGRVVEGGISGVLLSPDIAVVSGLTQGCSPIGP